MTQKQARKRRAIFYLCLAAAGFFGMLVIVPDNPDVIVPLLLALIFADFIFVYFQELHGDKRLTDNSSMIEKLRYIVQKMRGHFYPQGFLFWVFAFCGLSAFYAYNLLSSY